MFNGIALSVCLGVVLRGRISYPTERRFGDAKLSKTEQPSHGVTSEGLSSHHNSDTLFAS